MANMIPSIEEAIATEAASKTGTLDLSGRLLDFGDKLTAIPDEVFALRHLERLTLSHHRFKRLPYGLSHLRNLKTFDVSYNDITEISGSIIFPHLKYLDLSYNKFLGPPIEPHQFANIRHLKLQGNTASVLTPALCDLGLATLDISNMGISTLPFWLNRLKGLIELHAFNNNVAEIPECILALRTLEYLDLGNATLFQLTPQIARLSSLRMLVLNGAGLSDLPKEMKSLSRLERLYLWNNQFRIIPSVVFELPLLAHVGFDNKDPALYGDYANCIKEVPSTIMRLTRLASIGIDNNPVEIPPPEVVHRGVQSIFDYYRLMEQSGKGYLYEAKALVVGEAGAGKTSLTHKLLDPSSNLYDGESTHGIAVTTWGFTHPSPGSDRDFTVNIWDFGGQEIYHATHQFFLTKRSVYILVADDRKEDTDFYYWLNVIELLSDSSPAIIVQNEKENRSRQIDESDLRGRFHNLRDVISTNLKTNLGLAPLISSIQQQVAMLPHIGTVLPRSWVNIRKALVEHPSDHISIDEYFEICSRWGLAQRDDQLRLSEYFHDLGVCLHFDDDPLLKRLLILKPAWGTEAVYKILDDTSIIARRGRFEEHDLRRIWRHKRYAGMHGELLRLMLRFKLCYQLPDTPKRYIAPQLLHLKRRAYDWDGTNNLVIRYKYGFMPKGIISRFIVSIHSYIAKPDLVWKTGVVIEKGAHGQR